MPALGTLGSSSSQIAAGTERAGKIRLWKPVVLYQVPTLWKNPHAPAGTASRRSISTAARLVSVLRSKLHIFLGAGTRRTEKWQDQRGEHLFSEFTVLIPKAGPAEDRDPSQTGLGRLKARSACVQC